MIAKLRSLARNLRGRVAFEDGMDAEMRFHLESRTADLVRRGVPPVEAARQARLEFGSIEKQKDEARASVGMRLLDEAAGDLRYALRTFARNKGFTAAAVVTLALGIGANAAIFNLIDALVLRMLPVSRPEQLLQVAKTSPDGGIDDSFSYPMVRALDARQDLFSGVAGFGSGTFTVRSGASMQRVRGAYVNGAFYETLGLTPVAGRLLTRTDDEPGAPMVAVLSYPYWERQFGASPAAVGQTLVLNGVPVVIAGVSARGFTGATVGAVADLTLPMAFLPHISAQMAPLLGPGNTWVRVLARLRPGLQPEAAESRLASAWPGIAEASIDPRWSVARKKSVLETRPLLRPGGTGWTFLRSIYVKPLQILMGVVALVLLIACANVASLLLARASARHKEISVRLAIGASRARIVRQLLVESLTLSLMGAAGAIVIARVAGGLILSLVANGRAGLEFDLTPGWRVLAFTAAVAIGTAVLFGIAPALHATAREPAQVLKDDARTAASRSRLLPALVTVQMALSLVLLIGAALFIRTLRNLHALDPGFRPEGVLIVGLDQNGRPVPASVLDDLRGVPGVSSASLSTHTPLSGATWGEPALPAGQPLPERDTALFVGASPGFFATLQLPIVAGRDFTDADTRQAPAVAMVNERYAQRHFPNQNPLGRHLSAVVRRETRDLEIVGVVRATNTSGLRNAPPPTVYVPYAQLTGFIPTTIEIRTNRPIGEITAVLRPLLQPLLPNAPIEVEPLSSQVYGTLVQERMMAALASAVGLLALVLAGVGIYGLLAYSVARRTREIGIRMALGAKRAGVVALILRGARAPLVVGIAAGLPVAWALSRLFASMLFGLTPADPIAIGGATMLLVLVAHLAAYLPARRAARVDPLIALKCE